MCLNQSLLPSVISDFIYHVVLPRLKSPSPTTYQSAINMRTVLSNEAGPPTTHQHPSPAFLAQSLQPNVYAACIIVTIAATIALALRILCRRLAKAQLWWDDWIIIAALVSLKCEPKMGGLL